MAHILAIQFAKKVLKINEILNVIIRFIKFRFTLYRAFRLQSIVVFIPDVNLLDAINIGEKILLNF